VRGLCTQPFGYVALASGLSVTALVLLGLASILMSNPAGLYAENGVVEWLSVACWLLALVVSAAAARRHHVRPDGLVFAWLIVVSLLASARELDFHVFLNPAYMGELGLRFKPGWFLDRDVSLLLRLAWGAVLLLTTTSLVVPPLALQRPIRRLVRSGDTAIGLLLLSAVGLVAGFALDDLLRGAPVVSRDFRQACEETCELLGALFFMAATCCLFRKSFSSRSGQDAASARPFSGPGNPSATLRTKGNHEAS
jgi:hypothetical protein